MGLLQDANQSIGKQTTGGSGLLQQSGFSNIKEVRTTKQPAKTTKQTQKIQTPTPKLASEPSFLNNLRKSLSGGIKTVPGQFQQAGGIILGGINQQNKMIEKFVGSTIGKGILRANANYNVVSGVYGLLEKVKPKQAKILSASGETVKKAVSTSLDVSSKQLRESGQIKQTKALEEFSKDYTPSKGWKGIAEMAVFNLPQMATTVTLTVGTGLLTKNPYLATTVGMSTSYGLGASEVYSEARRGGLTDTQALPMSQAGGLLIGAIDFFPMLRLLRKAGVGEVAEKAVVKSIVKKVAQGVVSTGKQAGYEGVTESIQTIVGNAFKATYTENQDLLEGVTESFFVGALLGGVSDVTIAGIMGIKGNKQSEDEFLADVEKKIDKAITTPKESRTAEQQKVVDALLERTVSPDDAVALVIEEGLEKTPSGREILIASTQAKETGQSIKIVQKEGSQDVTVELVDSPVETEGTDEIFDSLLESQEAQNIELEDTPDTEKAREEIQSIEDGRQITQGSNETKKNVLDYFDGSQIKNIRAIKRSLIINEDKQNPPDIASLKAYDAVIESVMEYLGTRTEDEALRFIREDFPDPVQKVTSREEQKKVKFLESKIKPKEVGVPRSQLPVQGQPLSRTEQPKTIAIKEANKNKNKQIKTQEKTKTDLKKEIPTESKPSQVRKLKASRLETRIRGLLNEKAEDLIEKYGVAGYRQLNKQETISRAVAYVESNPSEAMKVLLGQVETPEGLLKNAIYIAMEQRAKGDLNLARKLASLQSTRFGQEISILTELDPTSPVKLMEQIVRIREAEFEKRYKNTTPKKAKQKVVENIKAKIKKPDKYDWNTFINSIEC